MTSPITLKGLNHVARRCIDADQPRQFHEDVPGLPLAHTVTSGHVPSTGEHAPCFHLFLEMGASHAALQKWTAEKRATQ